MVGTILAYIFMIGVDIFMLYVLGCGLISFIELIIEKIKKGKQEIREIEQIRILKALKEKLDYNTMFRVLPHSVAKQVADYLEQNEDIKKWLKEE